MGRKGLILAALLALPTAGLSIAAPSHAYAAVTEIRVISPGVISNSGLSDVAAAFEKKTGVKVTIQVDGMGTIMNDIRTQTPAADEVMLPMDLMGTMVLSNAASDFTPLGRAEIGLFKKHDATRPDITSEPKLHAAMQTPLSIASTATPRRLAWDCSTRRTIPPTPKPAIPIRWASCRRNWACTW